MSQYSAESSGCGRPSFGPSAGTRPQAPSRSRPLQQVLLGNLEHGDNLLALYRGKLLEEHLDGIATLKIINEVLYWYAGTGEDRGAAHYLGIGLDRIHESKF